MTTSRRISPRYLDRQVAASWRRAAGRLPQARQRKNREITAGAVGTPGDYAHLALAQAEKRDFAEARRLLKRLRAAVPDPSGSFWDNHELALFRSEVESVCFDSEFPSDPFQSRAPR